MINDILSDRHPVRNRASPPPLPSRNVDIINGISSNNNNNNNTINGKIGLSDAVLVDCRGEKRKLTVDDDDDDDHDDDDGRDSDDGNDSGEFTSLNISICTV